MNLEKLLTVKQAAEYLQVHPFTLYAYIHTGTKAENGEIIKLKASRFGNRLRIEEENLINFKNLLDA